MVTHEDAVVVHHSQHSSDEEINPLRKALQDGDFDEAINLLSKESAVQIDITAVDSHGRLALHYAADNGDERIISRIFEEDPSLIDALDENGYTPLTLAVMSGNMPAIHFLIEKRANINHLDMEKHSLVQWAVVCCQPEVLNLLLERGAITSTPDSFGAHALHYATMMSQQEPDIGLHTLHILLKHQANVNCGDMDERTPFLWAASAGATEAMMCLVQAGADKNTTDRDQLSAAHCAASRGHSEVIEMLLQLSADSIIDSPDRNGATPLFYAVTLGHFECAKLLLAKGAKPNHQDRRFRCASHCAAAKGQLRILKLLRQCGASFEIQNYRGDLPLHEAVQAGSIEVVEWLLTLHPSTLDAPNHQGRTALHLAAANGNMELCVLLCSKGAIVNPIMLYKEDLMTPLDLAEKKEHEDVAEYLRTDFGAKNAAQLPEDTRRMSRSRLELQIAEAKSLHNFNLSTTDGSTDANIPTAHSEDKRRMMKRRPSRELRSRQMQTSRLSLHEVATNTDQELDAKEEKVKTHQSRNSSQHRKRDKEKENHKRKKSNLKDRTVSAGGGGDSGEPNSTSQSLLPKSTSTSDLPRSDRTQTLESEVVSAAEKMIALLTKQRSLEQAETSQSAEPDAGDHKATSSLRLRILAEHEKLNPPPDLNDGHPNEDEEQWPLDEYHSNTAATNDHQRDAIRSSTKSGGRSAANRYIEEKRIFQELANLKRMQIQYGKVQETVLVRRLVETFCRQHGLNPDDFPFQTFNGWEKFLYDQLKYLYYEERKRMARFRTLPTPSEFDRRLRRAKAVRNESKIDHLTRTYGIVPLPVQYSSKVT